MNSACLLVGSNIEPIQNTRKAMAFLRSMVQVERISRAWVIPSIGSPGPDFINFAVQIATVFTKEELKTNIIAEIERTLKRVRSSDKNAPRTIDIDIILFNGELIDTEIWNRPYVALPVADLVPDLPHPGDDLSLHEVARDMQLTTPVHLLDDFPLFY